MNVKDKLLSQIPIVKIANYAFHNSGNLSFQMLQNLGMNQQTL